MDIHKWRQYEREKNDLLMKGLSAEEYEDEIRKILKRLKL